MPYTIVRATQFAEFTDAITGSMTVGDEVRVPDALIQPIAASAGRSSINSSSRNARRYQAPALISTGSTRRW